jgi:hypothetical protein
MPPFADDPYFHRHGLGRDGHPQRPGCRADPVPALIAPAVSRQSQQGFWGRAQAGDKQMPGLEWFAVAATCCHDFNDPARADPLLTDVVWRLFRSRPPGDASAMADP